MLHYSANLRTSKSVVKMYVFKDLCDRHYQVFLQTMSGFKIVM